MEDEVGTGSEREVKGYFEGFLLRDEDGIEVSLAGSTPEGNSVVQVW